MVCTAAGRRPDQHGGCLRSPAVPWFVKTEQFLRPYSAMKPHLESHRRWVEKLRGEGVVISSGYLVDGEVGRDQPFVDVCRRQPTFSHLTGQGPHRGDDLITCPVVQRQTERQA